MSQSVKAESFWQRNADRLGVGGSVVAALCCLGVPALLSVFTALGLGFLINDAVLLPLMIVFLVIAIYGLYSGARRHGQWSAVAVGGAGAVLLLASMWFGSAAVSAVGIVLLVAATLWNVRLRMRASRRTASLP